MYWFFRPEKSQKSIGSRVNFGEVNLGLVRFFGHPAFALAPYKCDYFTSFTQGTDGPPSPTVETFLDLENPTTLSPFTFSSKKIHHAFFDIGNRIYFWQRLNTGSFLREPHMSKSVLSKSFISLFLNLSTPSRLL